MEKCNLTQVPCRKAIMDVLVIFLSGFISAKVCDYVHELEREENEK